MKIDIRGLRKSYEDKLVFHDLNLTFAEGQITCIMGMSGCGKTTLLNILLNLVKADDGEITGLHGKKISAVFQENRLLENFSVMNNIEVVLKNSGNSKEIMENLKEVGLLEEAEKRVSSLSGGMKRRVSIVRAVMAQGDIIIMDEPFKGLDDKTKKLVISYLKNKTKGKTIIMATHSVEEIELLEANLIEMKV